MANLVLCPMLRYTGSTQATVWVETDAACDVTVLDARARTFHVEGHHYALVVLEDLEPGASRRYEVHLDGVRAWPPADGRPPSSIHTRSATSVSGRLVFGSCRVGDPAREPYTLSPEGASRTGFGIDALWALSRRLQSGAEEWPDCLLLLGDQVYADETSEETRAFIRVAQVRRLVLVEVRTARFRQHDERALVELVVGQADQDVIEFAAAVFADPRRGQFRQPVGEVDVGARVVHPPAVAVAIRILAEHDPAEHEGAVIGRIGLNRRPAKTAESLLTKPFDDRCRRNAGRDERHQYPASARRQAAKSAHQNSLLGPEPGAGDGIHNLSSS